MKKIILGFIFLFFAFSGYSQVLGVYSFTGTTCGSNTAVTTNNLTGGTFSVVTLVGGSAAPVCTAVGNALGTSNWTTTSAFNPNQYVQLTVTTGSTKEAIIKDIYFSYRKMTANGPSNLRMAHNRTGTFTTFSDFSASYPNSGFSTGSTGFKFTLPTGSPVVFRLYASGASGISTVRILEIDDLVIKGCEGVRPTSMATLTGVNVTTTSVALKWNQGNGSNCLILCKPLTSINSITGVPVNGTDYTTIANPTLSSFPNDIDGAQVVYAGPNTSTTTIFGLNSNTTYYFAIFEYNAGSTTNCSEDYNTTSFLSVVTTTSIATSSLWTGAADFDWSNGANWSDGVPSASIDAIISSSGIPPEIQGISVSCRNLDIQNSATLSITYDGVLDVSGNFTNSGGTFDIGDGSGTVNLSGTGNQSISGINTFGNLFIDKSTGGNVNIASGANMQTIRGFLTVNSLNGSNSLYTNWNLTFYSDQSTTAALIDNNSNIGSGGSVNGNITIQRWQPGGGVTHIFGPSVASASIYDIGQGTYNVLLYSETGASPYTRLTNSYNGSYRRVNTGGATSLTAGRGYSIRKDASGTVNFTGIPNNGPVSLTSTRTLGVSPTSDEGWNMLSNPYPSAMDWSLISNFGTSGVSQSGVAIWDGTNYTATSIIPSGVGFFVQETNYGTNTISLTNGVRIGSGSDNNTSYREEEQSKWFYLYVSNPSTGAKDALAVSFDNDATNGFESNFDLTKPYASAGPYMFTWNSNKRLMLSVVPYPETEIKIPVTLHVYTNATYRFTTSSFNDWYTDYAVFLIDSTSSGKQVIDLNSIANYDFIKNTTDADTSSRFALLFKYQPGANNVTTIGINTFPGSNSGNPGTISGSNNAPILMKGVPDDELFIEVINTAPGITLTRDKDDEVPSKIYVLGSNLYIDFGTNLTQSDLVVYDLLGRVVFELNGVESKGKRIIPMLQVDKSSVYIVKMRNSKEFITRKIIFN